jgi:hypothetical protein
MTHDPKYIGQNVFLYRSAHLESNPLVSAWQLIFYKVVGFVSFTISPDTRAEFDKGNRAGQ